MKQNENGFSVVEITVVVVIIGLVGAVGWLVFDRNRNDNDKASINTTQQSNTKKQEVVKKENEVGGTAEQELATQEKTTKTQYVNGASFELPMSIGDLLQYNLTSENTNLSSETLLTREKELYGDAELQCTPNGYPLGRISVKDASAPYPGFELVKKLPSGKYLFYQDDSKTSACYSQHDKLRPQIESQVIELKEALKAAM